MAGIIPKTGRRGPQRKGKRKSLGGIRHDESIPDILRYRLLPGPALRRHVEDGDPAYLRVPGMSTSQVWALLM